MTRDVHLVQTWYPQIYLACHTVHTTRSSSRDGLTARDSTLLAHLNERSAVTPTELARHLGIGKPALSAAVKRLVRMGHVRAERDRRDRRVTLLRLAPGGARAMRGSSVLETGRVRRLLAALSATERRAALEGLSLLAKAARKIAMERRRA